MSSNLPRVAVLIEDGRLGIVSGLNASITAKIGVSTEGDINVPATVNSIPGVRTTFGGGPLADALAIQLIGGGPVLGVRANASQAGTVSAVTQTGTGGSEMTVTGAPNNTYAIRVRVTRSAASAESGDAAYVVEQESGVSVERALPASGTVVLSGTGLALQFGAGTLVAGDVYEFTTEAPRANLADTIEALQALLDSGLRVRFVHIVGHATPTVAAAVDAVLSEYARREVRTRAILEARPRGIAETQAVWAQSLRTEWADYASNYGLVSVAAGTVTMINPLSNRTQPVNTASAYTMRRAAQPIGDHAGRVRAGNLPGVVALGHNEFTHEGLDAARFITLRTHPGYPGFFITRGRTMAPPGSDYDIDAHIEVILEACRVGYIAAVQYLGEDVPVDPSTGFILESEAVAFESYVWGNVVAALGDQASGVRVRANRMINLISTRRFEFDLGVIPRGYLEVITMRVGLLNPALVAQIDGAATGGDAALPGAPAAAEGGTA